MEALMMSASHLSLSLTPYTLHIHSLHLSSCSVLACRSQSPVRQISINWLLVDVGVTHLQTVLNLCVTPGLVRRLIQSEDIRRLRNVRGSLYDTTGIK